MLFRRLTAAIEESNRQGLEIIRLLSRLIEKLQEPPADPGNIFGTFYQDGDFMKLALTLPTFSPSDDVHDRELTVSIDGVANDPVRIGADPAMLSHEVLGLTQGQSVRVELRNVDDGDPPNLSANPSVFEGMANVAGSADTIVPGDAGAMGGSFVEE